MLHGRADGLAPETPLDQCEVNVARDQTRIHRVLEHVEYNQPMARVEGLRGRRETGRGFDDLPPWRRALLVGLARDLVLRPRDSSWGRQMLAKRGAKALQAKLRREDRRWPGGGTLQQHMTHVRVRKQQAVKRARQCPRQGRANLAGI